MTRSTNKLPIEILISKIRLDQSLKSSLEYRSLKCYMNGVSSTLEWVGGRYTTVHIDLESIGVTNDNIDHYFLEHNIHGKIYLDEDT